MLESKAQQWIWVNGILESLKRRKALLGFGSDDPAQLNSWEFNCMCTDEV